MPVDQPSQVRIIDSASDVNINDAFNGQLGINKTSYLGGYRAAWRHSPNNRRERYILTSTAVRQPFNVARAHSWALLNINQNLMTSPHRNAMRSSFGNANPAGGISTSGCRFNGA